MQRILAIIKDAVFRVAFGIVILIQLLLWVLLWGGMAALLGSNKSFGLGSLVGLALMGPFLVGAGNYFIYYRIVREEYVPREAEKWLEEHRIAVDRRKRRRKILRRWALWIPTVSVILICTFLDYSWAFATHLLHPGRGKLIGYKVPIPLTWTLQYSDLGASADHSYNLVVASRFRGLWKAGSGLYLGRRPPFQVSTMNFRSDPAGDPTGRKPASMIISEHVIPFDKQTITCREESPPQWAWENRYIDCSTPTGDFSANFIGNDQDAVDFYHVIEAVKTH